MASYLTDPRQSFVPTNLYTPNFEAINTVLNVRQNAYNQGFNQFKSVQNFAQNLTLTNKNLEGIKNEYINQAKEQLKDLPNIDFSIPENTSKAAEVFNPLLKNEMILRDFATTKKQNLEELNFKTFIPEDEFSYADSRNLELMNIQKNKLRNASLEELQKNPELFNIVEFTPFVDFNILSDKLVKNTGFAVESINSDGKVIYKTKNGATSVGNWTTFLNTAISDRYNKQFQILGRYELESGINKAKNDISRQLQIPVENVTDDVAKEYFLKERAAYYKKSYDDSKNNINIRQNEIVTELRQIQSKPLGELTNADLQRANDLQKQHDDNKKILTNLTKESLAYEPNTKEYKTKLNDFYNNPIANLASANRMITINNLAKKYAANESISKTKDPAWDVMMEESKFTFEQNKERFDQEVKRRELDQKDTELKINAAKAANTSSSTTNADGTPKQAPVNFEYEGTDKRPANLKEVTPLERFNERQEVLKAKVENTLTSPQVATFLASELEKILPEDEKNNSLSYINDWFKLTSKRTPFASFTEQEKKAFRTVNTLFMRKGVIKQGEVIADKLRSSKIVEDYLTKVTDENKDNKEFVLKYLSGISNMYEESKKAREEYMLNIETKKRLENDYITKSNLQNTPYVKKDKDGVLRAVTQQDILEQIPNVVKTTDGNELKRADLYKAVLEGKLKLGFEPGWNETKYVINTSGNYFGINFKKLKDETYYISKQDYEKLNKVVNLYGPDLKDRLKKVNNIVPQEFMNPNESGNANSMFKIIGTDKTISTDANNLLNEAVKPGNYTQISKLEVDESTKTPLTNNDKDVKIKNLLTSVASNPGLYKDMISTSSFIISPNGKTAYINIKFAPNISKDVYEALGFTDATDIANQTFQIDLATNTSSPTINKLISQRVTDATSTFNSIYSKKPMMSSKFEEALGYTYQVIPNPESKSVTVRIKKKVYSSDLTKPAQYTDWEDTVLSLNTTTPQQINDLIQEDKKKWYQSYYANTKKIEEYNKNNYKPEQQQIKTELDKIKLN